MKQDSIAYIYGLRAPDSKLYFYVGSSKHPPANRFAAHKTLARKGNHYNPHLMRKMRKVGIDLVQMDTIEVCLAADQFEREHELIQRYRGQGHPLTNIKLTPPQYSAASYTAECLLNAVLAAESLPEPTGSDSLAEAYAETMRACLAKMQELTPGDLKQQLLGAASLGLVDHEVIEHLQASTATPRKEAAHEQETHQPTSGLRPSLLRRQKCS